MKDWTWKNWLGVATVALGVWLVLYLVAWNIEYGQNDRIESAFFRGLQRFVLLEWVFDYQALVAGSIAGLAALSIVLNTKYERYLRREEAREAKIERTIESLLSLEITLRKIGQSISDGVSGERVEVLFDNAEQMAHEINGEAQNLCHYLLFTISRARIVWTEMQRAGTNNPAFDRQYALFTALLWAAVLSVIYPHQYWRTGRFQRITRKLSANDTAFFKPKDLEPVDLERCRMWIDLEGLT